MLHILHSADVRAGHSSFSRTLGVLVKSMAGSERRTAGPGGGLPESGHKFCTFFFFFFTKAAAAAASLGSSGMRTGANRRAGHLPDPRSAVVSFSRP